MKKITNLFWAMLLMTSTAFGVEFRRGTTFEDAEDSSFLVTVPGAAGSGMFVGYDSESNLAVIMTNYHVVGSNASAKLYSWKDYDRKPIDAKVVGRYYDPNKAIDNALLGVNADELKKTLDPPYIKLGGSDAAPSDAAKIISAGCPDGRFVHAWKGRGIGYFGGGRTFEFVPPPVPGQSGSGIVERIGGELYYVGTLTWRIGDSKGGAVPLRNFYEALFNGSASQTSSPSGPAIPPNAVECAASAPTILLFERKNCAACDALADKLGEIESLATIERVDVATDEGRDAMQRFGVSKVPTFVAVDDKRVEVWRVVGGGDNGIASVKANILDASTQELSTVGVSEDVDFDRVDEPKALDFRGALPVYETALPCGLFDDACRDWSRRRNGGETDDKPDASDGVLFGPNGKQIDGLIDTIEKSLAERARRDYWPKVRAVALKVSVWSFFFAYLACLLANATGTAIGGAFRRIKEFWTTTVRAAALKVAEACEDEGDGNVRTFDDESDSGDRRSSVRAGGVAGRKAGSGRQGGKKSGAK